MSKEVQPFIFIDEDVSSVNAARDRVEMAWFKQKALKADLWGLIMATPKDITPNGEDPIAHIRERFEDIWDGLWDAFVDDYKYTVVADDVELNNDSLVAKQWEEERKSIEKLREESQKRTDFFNKFRGVLSPYNFDDCELYEEYRDGKIVISEPFTEEQRLSLLEEIKFRKEKTLKKALKNIQLENGE